MLEFEAISQSDPGKQVLRAGELTAEGGLVRQVHVGGKRKQLVGILRISIVYEGPAHLQPVVEFHLGRTSAHPEPFAPLVDFIGNAQGKRIEVGIQ